jgi:uroporphyrinogen decarboxylase
VITGRENFQKAIEFKSPAYLPCILGGGWVRLYWLWEKDPIKLEKIKELQTQFPDDQLSIDASLNREEPVEVVGIPHWVDEWGTGWANHGYGANPEFHPLASDFSLLDSYSYPDAHLSDRLADMDRLVSGRGDRYTLAHIEFTLFERMWLLRSFKNGLVDPYREPRRFAQLRDRILEFDLGMIDEWSKRGVDGFFFTDDWGTQEALLIRPADWRKFYKPAYQILFDRVHSQGAHVWMHMCGNILEILPDMIDMGLNVYNSVQPRAIDVHLLAKEYGGKVAFNGGVDVQETMVHGTPEDVKNEVRTLVDLFGRYNGGYIGGLSHTVMPETPLDNVIALYEAFLELR